MRQIQLFRVYASDKGVLKPGRYKLDDDRAAQLVASRIARYLDDPQEKESTMEKKNAARPKKDAETSTRKTESKSSTRKVEDVRKAVRDGK